jgi:Integron cassette protein VCH_CASS1 chain
MALVISDVEILKEYLNGAESRADHHATNVNEIVYTLIGAVIAKSTEQIKVRTYNGSTANSLWFKFEEKIFAIKYNHNTQKIELLERSEQGRVIASFDNNDTAATVRNVFLSL